ncbi:prephenate dehydratase [Sciscionella sediminilitoris]|uniref:prephenate dehydratase n=1 Tax=Sciscionella sediminilitoris TaxID=1445613 RepID=UPI0018D06AEF|nr:prephenate dehydratase [Sciscionella sp. SE31]
MMDLVYFGPQGTFTEQAARALAPDGVTLRPAETIPAALDQVRAGAAEYACVPVENSVEGAVPATMDALAAEQPVVAVAEHVLPIRFTVLTRDDNGPIETVASHPHALAQVSAWLDEHLPGARRIVESSTAAAAVAVAEGRYDAAVCAPVVTQHQPLHVYAEDVADVRDALTRFLLVRKPGTLPEPSGCDRTSVVAVTENRPGSLSELLVELAVRDVNLTRLDARPTRVALGEYRFYLDFDGHIAQRHIGEAVAALYRRTRSLTFLGSYPKADDRPTGTTEAVFGAAAEWLAAIRAGERA